MTRIPGAEWVPGPEWKTGYGDGRTNIMAGVVGHSAEGYEAGLRHQLWNPAAGSWTGSILKDGRLLQHYELEAVCYASGNKWANQRFPAFEHEGMEGEPLTDAQYRTLAYVVGFIADIPTPWPLLRWPVERRTLWDHREVATAVKPNAGPTVCPSYRIDWGRVMREAAQIGAPPVPQNPPGEDWREVHVGAIRLANHQIARDMRDRVTVRGLASLVVDPPSVLILRELVFEQCRIIDALAGGNGDIFDGR